MRKLVCISAALLILLVIGCATESSKKVEATRTDASRRVYTGDKSIVVGGFENRSEFMRGVLFDGEDKLGGQAKTILMAHLTQTNRFMVLDRDNMNAAAREAGYSGTTQQTIGARFILSGAVTEFGRRETGDM